MYHSGTNRGSASLNLLGGLLDMPPEPPAGTTGSFNITVDNVSINSLDYVEYYFRINQCCLDYAG